MFGVSDPKSDGSYMNRSKYTESFIAANILSLPEYGGLRGHPLRRCAAR